MGPTADERRAALQQGRRAESFVALRLEQDGWQVLARNWSGGGGELDLVVQRDQALRFVEVKARASQTLDPLEQITPAKVGRLRRAAEAWLVDRGLEATDLAFLVAIVDLSCEPFEVDWLDDAFDG